MSQNRRLTLSKDSRNITSNQRKSPAAFAVPPLKDIAVMEDEKPFESVNDSSLSMRAVGLDADSGLHRIKGCNEQAFTTLLDRM